MGNISGDIQFRFFLIHCAIFFLSLLAAPSLDCKELARDKPDFIRCAADLKEALNSNNLGERISFGYINYEGGIPYLADYNGEQLLVKGNGEVTFKNIAFFIDELSKKCALSSIEYHYSMDEYTVREICEEFLKSGFFEKKFAEERMTEPPETPYFIIFFSLDGVRYEKKFIVYLDIDLVQGIHKNLAQGIKMGKGIRMDGAGLPSALERLQYLLYIVTLNRTKDKKPKGSVYNREIESMPKRIDFNRNR